LRERSYEAKERVVSLEDPSRSFECKAGKTNTYFEGKP